MPPIETSEQGGIKIMIMADLVDSKARLGLTDPSKLGMMERSKHASENSPSAVSDIQEYELRCSKSSLLPLDVNNAEIQNTLTMTKKIIVQKGNEKETATLQFPICTEKKGKPFTTGIKTSFTRKPENEKIELHGKFSFESGTKQWNFDGTWICSLEDGSLTSALPFSYKSTSATVPFGNKNGILLNDSRIGDLNMPEKLIWSGTFSNILKKQHNEALCEVKESFELRIKPDFQSSEMKQTESLAKKQDVRYIAEGSGRNKFGNFTLRGYILGTSFNGLKEYYRVPSGQEISLNLRKRNKDVRRLARLTSAAPVPKATKSKFGSSAKVLSKSQLPHKSEQVQMEIEKSIKPLMLRVQAGKKRPRDVPPIDTIKPTPTKKARAKKRIQEFIKSITSFAIEKAEARSRTFKDAFGGSHLESQENRKCLKQSEKARKLIRDWNGVKGQFAPPQACIFESHHIFKGFDEEVKQDGLGVCAYSNGFVYEGEFLNGRMNGRGMVIDSRGAIVYQGEFHDDRIHGVGTFFFPNGDRYDGEWKEGYIWGWGIYKEAEGHCYKGEWAKNKRHGYGSITFRDGSTYTGEWAEDQLNGRGTLHLARNLTCDGTFKKGRLEGKGLCSYDQGGKYEGNFKSGVKDGRGTYTFSNGAVHEGRFRNDKIDGTGFLKMICDKPVILHCDEIMIPINCQSEMRFIHLKAGFSEDGT